MTRAADTPDRRSAVGVAPSGSAAPRGRAGAGARVSAWRSEAAAVVGISILALTFLWELWAARGVPIARDMQLYFVPLGRLVWGAVRSGEGFLWTSFLGTGSPLLANLQTGFFYPPTWVHGLLPFLRSFSLLLVAHFLFGGLAMYALCRRVGLPVAAAFLAAVSYMLGGYYVSLTNLLTVLQVSAWLPLQCLTVVHHLERRTTSSFLTLAGVHLLSFLAGAPLTFLLGAGVAVAYATLRITRLREGRRRASLVLVGSMTLVAGLVAGLSMVQLLPMAEYVAASVRAEGLPLELATRYSLEPIRLQEFLVPPSFKDPVFRFGDKARLTSVDPWLFSVYLGASILVPVASAFGRNGRRPEVLFWSAVALLGLALSLGQFFPLYRWLHGFVPGFGSFRYPERFLVLTAFAVPMLAAHGLSGLRSRSPAKIATRVGGAVLLLLAGLRAFLGVGRERLRELLAAHFSDRPFIENFDYAHSVWSGQLDHALAFLMLALAGVAAYKVGWMRDRAFAFILIFVCAVDLWLAHRHLVPVVDEAFFEGKPAVLSELPHEPLRSMYRYRATPFDEQIDQFLTLPGLSVEASKWLWHQTLHPNTGAYQGLLTHDSGDAIHLLRERDESHFLALLPPRDRWRLLRLASVKYVYSMSDLQGDGWSRRVPLDSLPGWIYTVDDPVPRAYLASDPHLFDREIDALNAAIHPDFDPRRSVALVRPQGEEEDLRAGAAISGSTSESAPEPEAWIVSDSGSEVRVAVSTARMGHLVLTDTYYPGWRALVDGEERPILQANYFYRAVALTPRDREVVFRYEPRSFTTGLRISVATLASLLMALALLGWRRYRRRVRPLHSARVREFRSSPNRRAHATETS